jgi:hypothetical protein
MLVFAVVVIVFDAAFILVDMLPVVGPAFLNAGVAEARA